MNEPKTFMISVDEALERITAAMKPLGSERVGFEEAAGRFLAEDVSARRTQPPFDVSAMDGYALRSEDAAKAPFTLRLVGEVAAGGAFAGSVERGTCVRIFTGGRVPAGTDTVIMQEETEVNGVEVTFAEAKASGNNIRKAGADFTEGTLGISAGTRLRPQEVGFLAAMNVTEVSVARRPKVAILATGDELARPGEKLGPNQIISSNNFTLAAQVRAWGGDPLDLGIARDTEDDLRAALAKAAGADVLVTLGGASVGDHDLVQKVLRDEGMELSFWKIAMKPGKPLIFGNWNGMPMLGLPGNPVSSFVCSHLYLKPALYALQGSSDPKRANALIPVRLGSDVGPNGFRQDYIRVRLSEEHGGLIAHPFSAQDSSHLSVLSAADALLIRKPHAPAAKDGEEALAILLREA